MAEKRLTRQELKEDPLVTGAFRARAYVTENRDKILWVLGIFALLVLGGFWYLNGRSEKEAAAETLLTRATLELQTRQLPLALQDLRQLVERQPDTHASREALYYLGNAYFQMADYDQAEHYYGEFLKRSGDAPIITASAYAGRAACLELKGKAKQAAADFKKAVEVSKKSSQTPDYLVGAIRTYSALGDSAAARAYFVELKKDFPIYREQINQALLYMAINGTYESSQ